MHYFTGNSHGYFGKKKSYYNCYYADTYINFKRFYFILAVLHYFSPLNIENTPEGYSEP